MDALLTGRGLVSGLVFFAGIATGTWIVTRWVTNALLRRAVLDRPNERSSHTIPTPRGGGIAVLALALPLMAMVLWLYEPGNVTGWAVLGCALVLGVISGIDDLGGLPVGLRFAVHIAAVAVVLMLVPSKYLVFQGQVPLAADRILAGLAWIWFLNLFNFMDGIDGIAGVETVAIGLGVFGLILLVGGNGGSAAMTLGLDALILAAASLGFLVLNWPPARVFLGDVGSVPLGFLVGWLLLSLAMWGYWVAALILPAYYLADSGITITRRALRGERVWHAHAEHFYQRAVQRGWSHGRVSCFIAIGNVVLVALALLSSQVVTVTGDIICLAGAGLIVAFMLTWMARATPPESGPEIDGAR